MFTGIVSAIVNHPSTLAAQNMDFGWPQVAAIAGGTLVVIVGLVGVLLGIILKKANEGVNQSVTTLCKKVDQEVIDRKTSMEHFEEQLEKFSDRLEKNREKLIEIFSHQCSANQSRCAGITVERIENVRRLIGDYSKKVDRIQKEQGETNLKLHEHLAKNEAMQ